jgi:hypothetical protein
MYKSLRYIFWLFSILFMIFFIHLLSKCNFNLILFFENNFQYIPYIFGVLGIMILGDITYTQEFGYLDEK